MLRIVPLAVLLAACAPQAEAPAPAPIVASFGAIETDAAGRCFARAAAPTRTDIVEEMIEVVPETRAADGSLVNPAVFRTVTRPRTTAVGEGARFETVCPPVYTEAFVASLQRALLIRRAYEGPITGQYDAPTRQAVQQVQAAAGVDSPLLSVTTARSLGILEVDRT